MFSPDVMYVTLASYNYLNGLGIESVSAFDLNMSGADAILDRYFLNNDTASYTD